MTVHDCKPPIGANTPTAWTCAECGQRWERREDSGDSSWRWPGEERVRVVCPFCRLPGLWAWPPDDEEDLAGNHFTPPRGHTTIEIGGVEMDTCPILSPASDFYDPRPPWKKADRSPKGAPL